MQLATGFVEKTAARTSLVGVMHIVDSLEIGGAERVAVNLVSALPRDRYVPYLCTTHHGGPLASLLPPDVTTLHLHRRSRLDVAAVMRMVSFIRSHGIRIVHAHGTTIFFTRIAATFCPGMSVVWHDHYGLCETEERRPWLYRLAAGSADAVVCVNERLARWAREALRVPASRVWYVPNLACPSPCLGAPPQLPGSRGFRIVCVANFRRQKDHFTLLRAMSSVVSRYPEAHLFLVGAPNDPEYLAAVRRLAYELNLHRNVLFLGQREDVGALLAACDIGVLSSLSEGLPLALLEYAASGLGIVATSVGQCASVLDSGRAGILVPPANPERLADALFTLLQSDDVRQSFGARARHHVNIHYSPRAVMGRVCEVYASILRHQRELS
ncbi:MAG: glycosyltransferase [Candidatus Solibacter sp.]|jgi:glycosyltransferase involved in cell wall biosynthesis